MRFISNSFLLLLAMVCFTESSVLATEFEPQRFDRAFDVGHHTRLVINNEDGRTSVKAVAGGKIIVHVTKEVVGARSERDYERTLDKVQIELQQNGDEVNVAARYPKSGFQIFHFGNGPHVIVHFDITAPSDTDVKANVSDGPLEVSGFEGSANLRAGDGDIIADHLSGNVQISASDGKIQANALSGELELSSADGGIVAEDCSGNLRLHSSDGNTRLVRFNGSVDARTADGKLWVDGILKSIAAKTSDGSMEIRVSPDSVMENDWTLKSSDGDVELYLPATFSAEVEMDTSDGHIHTQVPIAMTGSLSRSHISGKLNNGGHLLQIHTADGDISISGE
jgi:DUF4097 and DUF4098 domain-containing protein YvlB